MVKRTIVQLDAAHLQVVFAHSRKGAPEEELDASTLCGVRLEAARVKLGKGVGVMHLPGWDAQTIHLQGLPLVSTESNLAKSIRIVQVTHEVVELARS